jgi:hypothetical protein
MILKIGDPPQSVYGLAVIHIFSPGAGNATLQNTHFVDEPTSWADVVQCAAVDNSAGVVLELAGSVQLVGTDPAAQCSIVIMSQGGMR